MKQPERGKTLLYLTRQDVVDIGMTGRDVRMVVRTTLAEHGNKRCEVPPKIGIHPVSGSLMHAMPAWVPAFNACGMKWIECFPDNHKYGLSQTSALLILNCAETGWPICIMDATWITAKRTPAVTALACEFLARNDTTVAGLIGAGVQGREHVLMLSEVLPNLRRLKIIDRFAGTTRRLIEDLQPLVPDVELMACTSIEEVVTGSLVIVSATAITGKPKPEVNDGWVERGALVAPLEFDTLWQLETFHRANKFLVDSRDELEHLKTVGRVGKVPPVFAELGEVVGELKPGRESDDELIVDMNIGMGIEDVAVGWELFQRACAMDIGQTLPV
jgi:ornithine cyclodeaminase/alanine dehydrogenase-like protein (mu-crystallin family)